MSKDLAKANRILDKACMCAGLDPVEVRVTMAATISDKLVSKGYTRQAPDEVLINGKPAKATGSREFT